MNTYILYNEENNSENKKLFYTIVRLTTNMEYVKYREIV